MRLIRPRGRLREVMLLFASLTFSWLVVELVVSVAAPELRTAVLQEAAGTHGSVALLEGHFAGLYQPDLRLGWVPTPNHRGRKWDVDIATGEYGVRRNGTDAALAPTVLAIGDSNTFGDEVADADTWPAQLERLLGVGVANAGVSSYGIDQMVLRAEDLVPRLAPRVLVVGLISDSLARAGQAVRHGSPKPFFEVGRNGDLLLRNVPVPRAHTVPPLRRALVRSYAASFVMDRLAPRYWWRGTAREFQPAPNDLDVVGPLLIERLVDLAGRHRIGLCVLFIDFTQEEHDDPQLVSLERWVRPLRGPGVRAVHSLEAFTDAATRDPRGLAAFSNPPPLLHFNAAGLRVLAELIRPEVAALLP